MIDATTKIRTLVVDDNRSHRDAMMMTLERLGHDAEHAVSVAEASRLLREHNFDVVIIDMELPRARGEDAAILAITGFASVENAVQAMQAGASEYIEKGTSLDTIRMSLQRALEGRNLRRENRRLASENLLLRNQAQSRYGLAGIIGNSSKMQDLFNRVALVAAKTHTVLVRGESGTGKELVARAIHYNSDRRDRALFTINCTALSSQLIESELFGHRKGSFTGATEDRKGLFEEAAGSTLFLDEIGDLPLDTQPKLLRAIELKEFKRVGENVSRTADVRIVAATNRNLLELVREGRFREDLYARLEVITLNLPALRERKEDIPLLVQHFVQKVTANEKRAPVRLNEQALAALMEYSWPRNVRELENVLTQAILFCTEDTLGPEHLQLTPTNKHLAPGEWLHTYTQGLTLREAKEKVERELVTRALDESQGNISRAAEHLGMQRPNLYRKLREFGLEPRSN